MAKLKLTIACGDYDIVRPLKEGLVEADGIELIFLTDMGPRERHWRLARKAEFDICEENVGAYFIAIDQGHEFSAIPVFMHRRFRHGFVFINTNAGIKEPKDLIGKKIGGTNFMPAGNIWMRGILEEYYGLPHRSVTWITERSEDIPFDAPPGLKIVQDNSKSLNDMLVDGDIPAMISPSVPTPLVRGDKRVARLFADYKQVEMDFYEDRHLPDHACDDGEAGDHREISMGRDQSGEGAGGIEAACLQARRQSAHGPARLRAHCGRGAMGDARPRPMGIRAHTEKPQEPRDHPALRAPAGDDLETASAGGLVRGHRPRRCCGTDGGGLAADHSCRPR